ncbi:MAG TPA: TolC family protein [bacterium]
MLGGGPDQGLDWPRAVELALAHHPDLEEARQALESKAHDRRAAFGGFLPSADGSFTRRRSRTAGTAPTGDAMSLGVDATQPLFTGFGTTGAYLEAVRAWDAQEAAYRQTSAEVRLRLRLSFTELLRLEEALEVNRRIADRRRENADLIALRYDAGREHRGSKLRAQAIADQAAFNVRATERAIESQSFALGRELGGRFWMPLRAAGRLEEMVPEPPEPVPDYAALAARTPEVEQRLRTAEAVQARVLSARAAFWPEAEGTFSYGYSGNRASALRDDASLLLTVTMPFFRGGRNVEGYLAADADYRAAIEDARSARDAAVSGLASAWTAFKDAREFLEVRRAFLDASRERADIVHSQYTSGLADFQDFDIAEQELADAEGAYVRALADAMTAEAQWHRAVGATMEEAADDR